MNLMLPSMRWPRPRLGDPWFGNGLGDLRPWSSSWLDQGPTTFPALNVWADESALHVEAELPGLALDALELTVLGDELTIAGERSDVIEEGSTWHRRERGVGKFSRVVRLPFDVHAAAVEARLEHGVLHVSLPKAEAARPRKIEVKTTR